ncbi:MAG: cupin domain-containing protein [Xanthomonadales bacterium]|nr:cupin domain-containing protein [Xanthomonadales bacterium]
MNTPLGEIGPGQFLAEYWQKKPCLVRQAFPGFKPLVNGDDLAGLACEEMAEARLVRGSFEAADWRLEHGPFNKDTFRQLPENCWTLLVQDVEKHYAPLQELVHQFSFIPDWRLDDLMISFAATGGSVGPHFDQYDVFLLQAEGKRRWRIAVDYDPELLPDCPLNVLRSFTAEHEWVLEPGDMLYLPPGVAHHGVALEPGMTWSIGARAPSAADLLQGLGEWLAFSADEGGRYSDPGLQPASRAGEIDRQTLQDLQEMMRSKLDDTDSLHPFLAAFMSRFRLANEPASPPDVTNMVDVAAALMNGATLMRNPWTRLTWFEVPGGARLFSTGQPYDCSVELAEALCGHIYPRIDPNVLDEVSLEVITRLVNTGQLLIEMNQR